MRVPLFSGRILGREPVRVQSVGLEENDHSCPHQVHRLCPFLHLLIPQSGIHCPAVRLPRQRGRHWAGNFVPFCTVSMGEWDIWPFRSPGGKSFVLALLSLAMHRKTGVASRHDFFFFYFLLISFRLVGWCISGSKPCSARFL